MHDLHSAIFFPVPSSAPQLLVSVRSAREAIVALESGADIIDIKEPSRGPLGMADIATIHEIASAVGERRPVSAALGDLSDPHPLPVLAPLAFAKIGMHVGHHEWSGELLPRFETVSHAGRIIVLYADDLAKHEPTGLIQQIFDWLQRNAGAGLLLDTHDKSAGDLFACLSPTRVNSIVRAARHHNLLIALAGRLAGNALRLAADLSPDIIGVRGAACTNDDRDQTIDGVRLREVRSIISGSRAPRTPPAKAHAAG